ncbi:MAG: type II toxin-antitoxin system VapC family toxin [Dehalococcoidia bacterium]
MSAPVLLDANVLLRLILDDHPEQAASALRLIEAAVADGTGAIVPSTLNEVMFVLTGPRLRTPPLIAARHLRTLLGLGLTVIDRDVVVRAVDIFERHHRDWDDCLLAAYALEITDGRIASFDRGLDRIPGVERLTPA